MFADILMVYGKADISLITIRNFAMEAVEGLGMRPLAAAGRVLLFVVKSIFDEILLKTATRDEWKTFAILRLFSL